MDTHLPDHEKKMLAQEALLKHPFSPKVGETWQHYKGNWYSIIAVSLKEDDLAPLITYRSLEYGICWTRTLGNFLEDVNGTPRFVRVAVP